MEISVPGDSGVSESEVVRCDIDETGTSKDRAGRRAFEALASRFERTDDVRIRRRVVERDGRAAHIRDCRKRAGLARHGDQTGGDRRSWFDLAGEERISRTVRHLVAIEAVL